MYLIGGPHPHKLDAQALLERALSAGERLVCDAEVLQEICHRYVAIGRTDAIQPAFDVITQLVDEVLPVDEQVAVAAKDMVLQYDGISARDAIHVAAMRRHGISRIMSFDRGFDALPGVMRVGDPSGIR